MEHKLIDIGEAEVGEKKIASGPPHDSISQEEQTLGQSIPIVTDTIHPESEGCVIKTVVEGLVHSADASTSSDTSVELSFPKPQDQEISGDQTASLVHRSQSRENSSSQQPIRQEDQPLINHDANDQDAGPEPENSCNQQSHEGSLAAEATNSSSTTECSKIVPVELGKNGESGGTSGHLHDTSAQNDCRQNISHFNPILDDRPTTPEQVSQPISRASPTHTTADDDKLSKFKALAVKLKKDLAKSRDELQSANNKLINLNQKLAATEKENTRVSLLYSQQVKNFNSLQSEYDRILDDYETVKKKFRLHVQQKSDDGIKDLKMQLDKKTNTIFELESRLADLELQIEQKDQLKSKLRDLTETIQSTEKKYHSTLREMELMRSELSKVSASSSTYKDSCNQLNQQLSNLQQALDTERVNHEKLRLSFESRVQSLKQELKSSQDDLQTLNLEFENYKVKVSQLMQDANLVQANSIRTFEQEKMKQLKTLNETLREEIKSLKQEIKEATHSRNELEKKVEELENSQETTKSNSSQLNRQLEERLKRLEEENKQLKLSLEQSKWSQPTKAVSISNTNPSNPKGESILKQEDLSKLDELSGDELTKELSSMLFPDSNGLSQLIKPCDDPSHEMRLNTAGHTDQNCSKFQSTHTHVGLAMVGAPLEILGGKSSILNDAHNQIDNLTQAYLESEKTNKLLSDQVTALKEEIRRLQRGNERLDLADNLEYLKNIVVKFISLDGQLERQRLIPVLSTMLKLSPEEQSKLQSATLNNDKGGFFRII